MGRGVGPALEAHDVLAVLGRSPRAPNDLRERTLDVARALPDLVEPNGREDATDLVGTGVAEAKFTKLASASGRKTTGVLPRARVGGGDGGGAGDGAGFCDGRLDGDGCVAKKEDEEHATALMRQMAPEWVDANLLAAMSHLNDVPGRRVSLLGIGYGGSAAMRATVIDPLSVISTVNIFGRVPQDVEELRGISGPVLTLFSEQDGWVGLNEIENFERLMFKLRNALQVARVDARSGF